MFNLVPDVIDKTLKKSKFDPEKVFLSLLVETNLNEEQAKKITEEVTRCMITIATNIKNITAPMIREVVNSTMLKYGYEKQRLQYTRIGLPYYDLQMLYNRQKHNNGSVDVEIIKHMKKEFMNVKKLIED